MAIKGSRHFGWGTPVWSPDGTRLLLNVVKDGSDALLVTGIDDSVRQVMEGTR